MKTSRQSNPNDQISDFSVGEVTPEGVFLSGETHRIRDSASYRSYIFMSVSDRGTLDGPTYFREFKQIESTDNGLAVAINQNVFLGE